MRSCTRRAQHRVGVVGEGGAAHRFCAPWRGSHRQGCGLPPCGAPVPFPAGSGSSSASGRLRRGGMAQRLPARRRAPRAHKSARARAGGHAPVPRRRHRHLPPADRAQAGCAQRRQAGPAAGRDPAHAHRRHPAQRGQLGARGRVPAQPLGAGAAPWRWSPCCPVDESLVVRSSEARTGGRLRHVCSYRVGSLCCQDRLFVWLRNAVWVTAAVLVA